MTHSPVRSLSDSNRSSSTAELEQLCQIAPDPADFPAAVDCICRVPVYHGDNLRQQIVTSAGTAALAGELQRVLHTGPGAFVIKACYSDTDIITRMNAVFDRIFADEASQQASDHFAAAGNNRRIWNAFEKSAYIDPLCFIEYYKNPLLNLVAASWLGSGYQMTAQVNLVQPGGKAQQPHRDYHLGFQPPEKVATFPLHLQQASAGLTLQGAIAHAAMPIASGPTMLLPYSQRLAEGYSLWRSQECADIFARYKVQLALDMGDALFFNPSLHHAAGSNTSPDTQRLANLLQISAAFGKPMESINLYRLANAVYPTLLQVWQTLDSNEQLTLSTICAEDYSFPTNLDRDPPVAGMAPSTHADLLRQALAESWDLDRFVQATTQHHHRRFADVTLTSCPVDTQYTQANA